MVKIIMRPNRIIVLAFVVATGLAVWVGCQTAKSSPPVPDISPVTDVKPGGQDAHVVYVAARLLEAFHYLQRPLDKDLSKKFFDEYINALDPRHENFLQSDLNEFAWVRTNLDVLTMGNHGQADLRPAFAIYQRFAERSVQHAAYVNELLKEGKFKFNTDEKIQIDRRHAPFPTNLDEAKKLWAQQLRYEFLMDKLSREISETNGHFTVKLPPGATTNIIASLERHYRWTLHMTTNWDSGNVLQVYLNALAHAYDPHTDYFSPPKAQDFGIDMNLALFGIGAQLTEDDGYCTIHELVPGGPAEKCKQLKPNDRIVAVAQNNKPPVNVVDMDLEKIVQMIRGPKGTKVSLTISPAEDRTARHVVTLVRAEIKLNSQRAKADLIEYPDGERIGVIDLPSFYAPIGGRTTPIYTSVDVARLIKKLKQEKVRGIILDLRSNPGGSLEEAVRFTGLFIKSGPVVLTRDSSGQISEDTDPDPSQLYAGPLVVLDNRFSASAAEIAAAALQDYGRAVIVGDSTTHGKGTVQQLYPIAPYDPSATNDPGELKITKGKFYRISGGSTQLKGVASDIVLPNLLDHSTHIGERALDNPLPWDTIQPVSYNKLDLVTPYLKTLRERDAERVATNQDFLYIKQDIAQFEESQSDKFATLNEHDAIKKREQIDRQNRQRNKERDSRPVPKIKIYELTVQDAAKPGLPAPVSYWATNYDVSDVVVKSGNMPKHNTVYVYTNFYANYVPDFTNYFQTNYPDLTDARFVFTNSASTNILAKMVRSLSSTNEIFKPVVSKSVSYDPELGETENILKDYISLLSKNGMLTADH